MTRMVMPCLHELLVRLERLEHRDAGADHRRHVAARFAQHVEAADVERVVGPVDHRRLRPRGAHVRRSAVIGHALDQAIGADGVAGIEHRDVRLRAHHREILERHLRRAILANRDAGVTAGHLDVAVADRGHPDEVAGASQERGKGRGERNGAARRKSHRGADHHLLGDEGLEEALRILLLELLAECRVLDVRIERHDAIVVGAEPGDRGAERFARRDLVAERVRRRPERRRRLRRRTRHRARPRLRRAATPRPRTVSPARRSPYRLPRPS